MRNIAPGFWQRHIVKLTRERSFAGTLEKESDSLKRSQSSPNCMPIKLKKISKNLRKRSKWVICRYQKILPQQQRYSNSIFNSEDLSDGSFLPLGRFVLIYRINGGAFYRLTKECFFATEN